MRVSHKQEGKQNRAEEMTGWKERNETERTNVESGVRRTDA
jgi:hypothetical protein